MKTGKQKPWPVFVTSRYLGEELDLEAAVWSDSMMDLIAANRKLPNGFGTSLKHFNRPRRCA